MDPVGKIIDKLLEIDDGVLSVAMVGMDGRTWGSKSKYHITNGFLSNRIKDDNGVWVRATLAMIEQLSATLGSPEVFVSSHEEVKLIIIPVRAINSLIALTVLKSTSAEYITEKISDLLAYQSYCLEKSENDYGKYNISQNN